MKGPEVEFVLGSDGQVACPLGVFDVFVKYLPPEYLSLFERFAIHSARRVNAGSMRAIRRVGKKLAAVAARVNSASTMLSVAGS